MSIETKHTSAPDTKFIAANLKALFNFHPDAKFSNLEVLIKSGLLNIGPKAENEAKIMMLDFLVTNHFFKSTELDL